MDKSKMGQLKVLMRQVASEVVQEELETLVPEIISEIKKVVDNRVKTLLQENAEKQPSSSGLTKKRIAEIIGAEFDSGTLRASTRTMQTPQVVGEQIPGVPKPAEEVVRAITRDYSDLMAKLNELRPDVKGVYRV